MFNGISGNGGGGGGRPQDCLVRMRLKARLVQFKRTGQESPIKRVNTNCKSRDIKLYDLIVVTGSGLFCFILGCSSRRRRNPDSIELSSGLNVRFSLEK